MMGERGVAVDHVTLYRWVLAEHNRSLKPFVWSADPDIIIAAASRGYQVLDSIH